MVIKFYWDNLTFFLVKDYSNGDIHDVCVNYLNYSNEKLEEILACVSFTLFLELSRFLTFLKRYLPIWKLIYKAVETYTHGCPSTHPYVYGRGQYCCDSFEFSEDKGLSGHIGRSFSHCRGAYTGCPNGENCVDFMQIQNGINTALKAGKYMTLSITDFSYKLSPSIVN